MFLYQFCVCIWFVYLFTLFQLVFVITALSFFVIPCKISFHVTTCLFTQAASKACEHFALRQTLFE